MLLVCSVFIFQLHIIYLIQGQGKSENGNSGDSFSYSWAEGQDTVLVGKEENATVGQSLVSFLIVLLKWKQWTDVHVLQ